MTNPTIIDCSGSVSSEGIFTSFHRIIPISGNNSCSIFTSTTNACFASITLHLGYYRAWSTFTNRCCTCSYSSTADRKCLYIMASRASVTCPSFIGNGWISGRNSRTSENGEIRPSVSARIAEICTSSSNSCFSCITLSCRCFRTDTATNSTRKWLSYWRNCHSITLPCRWINCLSIETRRETIWEFISVADRGCVFGTDELSRSVESTVIGFVVTISTIT